MKGDITDLTKKDYKGKLYTKKNVDPDLIQIHC